MTPISVLFRYIALRLIATLAATLIILTCLILLIDLIENMRFAEKFADGSFSFALRITLLRAPSLGQTVFPFIFLFGALWVMYHLNRRSELSVMRAAGLSIWTILAPIAVVAVFVGVFIITVIDPVSSTMLKVSEAMKLSQQGKDQDLIRVFDDGIWLRQRMEGYSVIINAVEHSSEEQSLRDVTLWRFDDNGAFVERVDATRATLVEGVMELYEAQLTSIRSNEPKRAPVYAIPSALGTEDLNEQAAPAETVSLWEINRFIALSKAAGLPTVRYQLRYHDLLSTPLKLLTMTLIAAAFSLRPIRMGGQLPLALAATAFGFAFFIISEVSTALGLAGFAPPLMASWAPAVIAGVGAATLLINLEEG